MSGVEALLGESLGAPRAVAIDAEGRVEQVDEQRWLLRLTIRSVTGERERVLEAATCQELGEVAIVLVAVAIDPSVEILAPSEEPDEFPEDQARDRDVPGEEAEALPKEPEREALDYDIDLVGRVIPSNDEASLRGSASVTTGMLIGPLPGVAPGLRGSLGLRWRMLAITLGASHWFERRTRLPASTVGGDLRLTTADVRACLIPSVRRLELPVCTGAELGALAGRGVGVTNPRRGRALWAAWVADAGATFMLRPWMGFGARAVVVVPMTRATFALDDIGVVHEIAPVGVQAHAGIELRFP